MCNDVLLIYRVPGIRRGKRPPERDDDLTDEYAFMHIVAYDNDSSAMDSGAAPSPNEIAWNIAN